jgi:hypothetical protein
MKLTTSLLLLTSSISCQDNSAPTSTTCLSKFDCKISEAIALPQYQAIISKCPGVNIELTPESCPFVAVGLNVDKALAYSNLKPQIDKCGSVTKDSKYTGCTGQCTDTDKDDCIEKCKAPAKVELVNCLAKLANQANVDAQKVVDCSDKCDQNEFPEIYDCDYSCKKSIYDSLVTDSSSASNTNSTSRSSSPSNNNSTSGSSGTNGNSNKDPKASNSTKSGSSGKSSAIASFGLNSFSAIAAATIIFITLV